MTTTTAPQHKSFTRIVPHKIFMDMIKEARRVDYSVEGEAKNFYQVKDNETGDKVFAGIRHPSGKWIATFFTLYWQEPWDNKEVQA